MWTDIWKNVIKIRQNIRIRSERDILANFIMQFPFTLISKDKLDVLLSLLSLENCMFQANPIKYHDSFYLPVEWFSGLSHCPYHKWSLLTWGFLEASKPWM